MLRNVDLIMLAASHAVAGAIIYHQIPHPLLSGAIALCSHPILDLVPHWDLNTRWAKRSKTRIVVTSLLDAGVGFTIGLTLFGTSDNYANLMLVMFLAQAPDWLEAPYHFGFKFPPFSTVKKVQHILHRKLQWPWGFYPQLGLLLIAFILH